MKCTTCKNGDTAPDTVTISLTRSGTIVVIKEALAEVCDNCGDYFLDTAVAERIYEQAAAAVARHAEVEILRFAA
jgi:YgiT-type zinc finger domain-containing protein